MNGNVRCGWQTGRCSLSFNERNIARPSASSGTRVEILLRSAWGLLILAACVLGCSSSPAWGWQAASGSGEAPPQAGIQLEWRELESGTEASFRGLAVVDLNTVWVSGAGGTVLRSTDGGQSFADVSVPGASELDFRDIHAFDANTAVVMNAGAPGRFFRTTNGGKNWVCVYDDRRPEVFFDAMAFLPDGQTGLAFGDAIGGRLCIVRTTDGAKTWAEIDHESQPLVKAGEGGFAASGTCMVAGSDRFWVGTGSHQQGQQASKSRILMTTGAVEGWQSAEAPLKRTPSSGVFSVCHLGQGRLLAVGGDYLQPEIAKDHFAWSEDGGQSWFLPEDAQQNRPSGFRSVAVAAEFDGRQIVIAAGTLGADVWDARSGQWEPTTDLAINVLAVAPAADGQGLRVFGAGPGGSIVIGEPK